MRAVDQPDQKGAGPEMLRVSPTETPSITSPTQVLIAIEAAGVNRPDCYQRAGNYKPPTGSTSILGLEVSGYISNAGPESKWNVGDEVCALLPGKLYIYIINKKNNLLKIKFYYRWWLC